PLLSMFPAFFFNAMATSAIYTLSLHDALPILDIYDIPISKITRDFLDYLEQLERMEIEVASDFILFAATLMKIKSKMLIPKPDLDRKSTRLNSSHVKISYAVFCLKKKKRTT